eukprot:gene5162-6842_t
MRILVVEDDAEAATAMVRGLTEAGHEVVHAVDGAFGLLEAVSKGTLDGGHGVLVYHYGKQAALALWGSGPAYAMDANMLLAWHKYGGGKELLAKLYASIGANV